MAISWLNLKKKDKGISFSLSASTSQLQVNKDVLDQLQSPFDNSRNCSDSMVSISAGRKIFEELVVK